MASHRSPTPQERSWAWSWGQPRPSRTGLALALVALVAVAAVVISLLSGAGSSSGQASEPSAAPDTASTDTDDLLTPTPVPDDGPDAASPRPGGRDKGSRQTGLAGRAEALVKSGKVPLKGRARSRSQLPKVVTPTEGRAGTGMVLGLMDAVAAPVGGPVTGTVSTSVANLPNRTGGEGFASSLRAITAAGQDFVMLNEVSGRSLDTMRAIAVGYDAYRDPLPDPTQGGSQSMNNVVMWRADRWNLVDAGRVKVVDDDRGYLRGRPFVWDRYLTWTVLQRQADGAVVSVLSTHLPTNPARYPAQPAGSSISRLERYSRGMDIVVQTVRSLSRLGPVLLGGDMNSHPYQGAWTAAQKMAAAGYAHVKDRAVMYLFHQPAVEVLAHRELPVASDHPAIVTTLDLGGQGPTP
jgi:endonuclease/exonuclease/phosphatase family metal-dependent hydrolase